MANVGPIVSLGKNKTDNSVATSVFREEVTMSSNGPTNSLMLTIWSLIIAG